MIIRTWSDDGADCVDYEADTSEEIREMNDPKKFETTVYIDRNKVLDEAVFLAICGLYQVRDGLFITGVVRLEMAREKLDRAIKKLRMKEK